MKDMRSLVHELLGEDLTSGQVLRGLRVQAGISQEELVEITGIARPNISALENDRTTMTVHFAGIFAAALNVHPADLLFPGGKFEKTNELKKIEKKAKNILKKKSS